MIRPLLTTLATVLAFGAMAHADGNTVPLQDPQNTAALFNTMYTPVGFDSNDNVQIVGEGMFENACYRPAPTNIKIDQEKKTIDVAPVAYKYNGLCLQVILPFDRVMDLGILKPGNYTITQAGATIGQIPVRPATTSSPDDFLYAPISQAYFHQQKDGTAEVLLNGSFQSTCMKMQEVKVDVQSKVITIQPIAEVENRTNCLRSRTPFEQAVKVTNVPKGRYLLHIRSMNGKAINNLIDVE